MTARSTLIQIHGNAIARPVSWPAPLERLALIAFTATIFLLGCWRPLPLALFSQNWTIGNRYQLLTLFNPQYRQVILYPGDISALVTIILWLLARLVASITGQQRAALRLGPYSLTLPLIGLATLAALSATQAILPILSLEIAAQLFLVGALVIAVINLRPPMWAIIVPLALLLAIEGTVSILQAQTQSTLLGHLLLNWHQEATALQSGASIVQLPSGARWLRAYGTFPHPNILGGFLCLALPVVTGAYLRLPWRSVWAWLLLASLALGLLALLLSFSRAAWLGILSGALWAGLLFWMRRRAAQRAVEPARLKGTRTGGFGGAAFRRGLNRQRWIQPALLSLLGIGLIIGLVATLSPVIQSRLLLSNSALEQRSIDERIVLLEASAVFFTQHPWLGVGAGNMPLVELTYSPTRNIAAPAHNVPIAIAVETGLFGLLLWLIPPIGALWGAWRRRFTLSPAGVAASAALVALLTAAQLDHYLWSLDTGRLLYWLAVTLAILWLQQEGLKRKSASLIEDEGSNHVC